MKYFAIYIAATGVIQQTCSAADVGQLELAPGQAVLEVPGVVRDDLWFVSQSALSPYPKQPSPLCKWNGSAWVDERDISAKRLEAIGRMKSSRDAAVFGGFVWGGDVFDSDERAQNMLMSMCVDARAGDLETQSYRLANNSWRTLSSGDMKNLWAACRAHVKTQFARFAQRESEIMVATSAQIAGIVW